MDKESYELSGRPISEELGWDGTLESQDTRGTTSYRPSTDLTAITEIEESEIVEPTQDNNRGVETDILAIKEQATQQSNSLKAALRLITRLAEDVTAMRKELQQANRRTDTLSNTIDLIGVRLDGHETKMEAMCRKSESDNKELVRKIETFETRVTHRLDKQEKEIQDKWRSNYEITEERISDRIHEEIESVQEKVDRTTEYARELDQDIHQVHKLVQENMQKIKTVQSKIDEFQKQSAKGHPATRFSIFSDTTTAARVVTPRPAPPTYEGTDRERPIKFLREFIEYCEATEIQQHEIKYAIPQSLKNSARDWWDLVENKVQTLKEFKDRFTKAYWSDDVQTRIRRNLSCGWYHGGRKLSRADYAIKLYGNAKDLTPTPEEKDIVRLLAVHFDEEIRRATISRGIENFDDLLELLQRCDRTAPLDSAMSKERSFGGEKSPKDQDRTENEKSQQSNGTPQGQTLPASPPARTSTPRPQQGKGNPQHGGQHKNNQFNNNRHYQPRVQTVTIETTPEKDQEENSLENNQGNA